MQYHVMVDHVVFYVMHSQVWYKGVYHVPNSKVHGANMGPIWGQQDPVGSHVGPMNFGIWGHIRNKIISSRHPSWLLTNMMLPNECTEEQIITAGANVFHIVAHKDPKAQWSILVSAGTPQRGPLGPVSAKYIVHRDLPGPETAVPLNKILLKLFMALVQIFILRIFVTWVSWCLKSPAMGLLIQQVLEANTKENIQAFALLVLLWGESTDHHWIPLTKGQ